MTLTACGSDNNAGTASSSASGQRVGIGCGLRRQDLADRRGFDRTAERHRGVQQGVGPGLPRQDVWRTTRPVRARACDQFIAGQVDFAGSDSALNDEQIAAGGRALRRQPGVEPAAGVRPGRDGLQPRRRRQLVLNGDVLAKIFQGQITKWNDPAIAALNTGATLPDAEITPIYRSDSSGTTDNFQKYLGAAAPQAWTKGAGNEFQGGVGEGAQKSAGVVQAVQATPGAIGYVEKGFADQAGLADGPDRHRQPAPSR